METAKKELKELMLKLEISIVKKDLERCLKWKWLKRSINLSSWKQTKPWENMKRRWRKNVHIWQTSITLKKILWTHQQARTNRHKRMLQTQWWYSLYKKDSKKVYTQADTCYNDHSSSNSCGMVSNNDDVF